MWTKGTLNGYDYRIKHFDEESEYGIDGGRISKLELRRNGRVEVNYDRGWDKKPESQEAVEVFEELCRKYN